MCDLGGLLTALSPILWGFIRAAECIVTSSAFRPRTSFPVAAVHVPCPCDWLSSRWLKVLLVWGS